MALDRSQKASPALEEQVLAWLKVSEERHQQVVDPLRMKKHQKQAPGTISAEDFLRPNPNVRNDDGILQNLTERVSSVKVLKRMFFHRSAESDQMKPACSWWPMLY
ncbi:hypothetical protein CRN15_00130 [Raoultella planticola]|uniref:hypothetical protein n=1 Tax=Klebsiella pneumoniae TaxID=573 RepID=UPI00050BFD6C|nr:hypothetical protein [Klebsiella pneumoniae]ATM04469.1 hypothetical protein CRT62_07490 [Raoultella planticola]HBS1664972.1 hypothetical protein [Klebsiella quasipneumoniae subsp. quasipneumoniae]ATM13373.1 hypothetical protein CRN15_00130 [Raoultella planticola]MCW9196862.1 hypothetical protein [Klebsiella pneumoniae]PHH26682.1 hypothetical protein CRX55_22795 [Raoultella planticola]